MNDNTCIICGSLIPEGRQICKWCEAGAQKLGMIAKPAVKTNGDNVREALSKLSDYKISHLEFCNIFDECDECPMNGMEKCKDTVKERQLWLKQEAK